MHGCVFQQGDVADAGATRNRALQQVVAQHLVVGQPAHQGLVDRSHVEQAFAGEAALAKHVLVELGVGRAVGVDAALAREQPVVARHRGRRRQRRFNAWLQDAVARDHTARGRVNHRLVERVGGQAHQVMQPAGGHVGVGIQRDDVADARCRQGQPDVADEGPFVGPVGPVRAAGATRLAERTHQLLQLAAFAFPAYPALLGV